MFWLILNQNTGSTSNRFGRIGLSGDKYETGDLFLEVGVMRSKTRERGGKLKGEEDEGG